MLAVREASIPEAHPSLAMPPCDHRHGSGLVWRERLRVASDLELEGDIVDGSVGGPGPS